MLLYNILYKPPPSHDARALRPLIAAAQSQTPTSLAQHFHRISASEMLSNYNELTISFERVTYLLRLDWQRPTNWSLKNNPQIIEMD
jgi:hypothetical protein